MTDRRSFLAAAAAFAGGLPADVKELAEVQVATIGPSDVVVFRHPRILSHAAQERIRGQWRALFPNGAKLVVLEEGASLEIVKGGGR